MTYDFSGAAARLVAVKVAGDNCIPPGRAVWTALAAPEVCFDLKTPQVLLAVNEGHPSRALHVIHGAHIDAHRQPKLHVST